MKKVLIFLVIMMLMLLCITSCGGDDSTGTGSSSNTENPGVSDTNTKSVYETLNELCSKEYNKISLDVSTVTKGIDLNSRYVISKSNVTYSVEQLNKFPTDGNFENVSSEFKTTFEGVATVENGKVTAVNGDAVTLPTYDELSGNFKFNKNYFADVKEEEGKFTATVSYPSDFLNCNETISDMTITVQYNQNGLESISITYNTLNSSVSVSYSFE